MRTVVVCYGESPNALHKTLEVMSKSLQEYKHAIAICNHAQPHTAMRMCQVNVHYIYMYNILPVHTYRLHF